MAAWFLYNRAVAYAAAEQWDSAETKWLRAVTLKPELTRAVFHQFRQAERWNEAGRFGRQLARQGAELRSDEWMPIPTALLLAGDQEGFIEVCQRMRETFATSSIPYDAERIVKVSLLWPGAIDPATLGAERFTRPLDDGTAPSGHGWLWAARALLALRSNDAESAVTYVARSRDSDSNKLIRALGLAVLALAQHDLHRHEEAKATLDETSQVIAQLRELPATKGSHDLLIAEILFREAKAKISP